MLNQSQMSQEGKENLLKVDKSAALPFSIIREGPSSSQSFRKDAQWSLVQKAKFAAYLQLNLQSMSGKKSKNMWKKFEEMGELIKTRNFRQCKLYHQKLIQQFETIPDIVAYFAESSPEFLEIKEKEKELMFKRKNQKLNEAQNKHQKKTGLNYEEVQAHIVEDEKKNGQEMFQLLLSKLKNFEPITFCA